MIKIFFINLLLLILFMILFMGAAFGIGIAMGTQNHSLHTSAVYVAVILLHLYLNYRLFKKRDRHKPFPIIISSVLIVAVYIGYLFIYR